MYNKHLKIYREYDKADKYIIGFEYGGVIYIATVNKLKNKWLFIMQGSRNRGKKIQMRLTQKHKQELIVKHNATPIATVDNFIGYGYNNGDRLEYVVRNNYGIEHSHDNLPFYKGCDIVVDGIGYSIKWEQAQIATYKTLNRLAKQS